MSSDAENFEPTRAIRISGPDARIHDYHEGEGTFATAVRELRTASPRWVLTELSRSNMRALSDVSALLLREKVDVWRLVCPASALGPIDSRMPRLAMALPRMLHAVDASRRRGLRVQLQGFPRCLLGPFAELSVPSSARAYGAPCDGCSVRKRCPGVDASYLERYGASELRAVTGVISSQPKRRR